MLRCGLGVLVLLCGVGYGQDTIWTRRFDSGRWDCAVGGGVGPVGQVTIVGETMDGSSGGHEVVTLASFSPEGDTVWSRTYASGNRDTPNSAVVDGQGNIVIACTRRTSSGLAGAVIKYDQSGNLLWTRQLDRGHWCQFISVATDSSLNIYVGGSVSTQTSGDDVILVKYSPDGDSLWTRTFDFGGTFEGIFALAMATDGGHIVGTGNTGDVAAWTFDFLTVKFTLDGDTVWSRRLDVQAEDWGCGIAADTAGSIYITGFAGSYTNPPEVPESCVVAKYSSTGAPVWVKVYGDPEAYWTDGYGIACDPAGNLLVCADILDTLLWTGGILLVNYSPAGETNWTRRYQPDESDYPSTVCLASPDIVYVLGGCANGSASAFLVMKLRYGAGIEEPDSPSVPNRFPTNGGATLLRRGEALRLAVNLAGDYRVSLCDAAGRCIRVLHSGRLNPGEHSFSVSGIPAGIYFCRLESGAGRLSWKVVLTGVR